MESLLRQLAHPALSLALWCAERRPPYDSQLIFFPIYTLSIGWMRVKIRTFLVVNCKLNLVMMSFRSNWMLLLVSPLSETGAGIPNARSIFGKNLFQFHLFI